MQGEIKTLWRQFSWLRYSMRYRDYFGLRHLNRIKLIFGGDIGGERDGITVVCGVKNRCDYRLINAFKSLRSQDCDQRLVEIILIDYDSERRYIEGYRDICARYNARYVRVDDRPVWNKSHCLNIGIRLVQTKYLCSTDVDVFFQSNYLSACIKELNQRPFQVLVSDFYNTPKLLVNGEIDVVADYGRIKALCSFQTTGLGRSGVMGPGINLTLTRYYKFINGYDEFYTLWGGEDFDLIKRFALMGLKIKDMAAVTSWIHQSHDKHEGISAAPNAREQIKQNKMYLNTTHSIVRNPRGWGLV